MRPIASTVCAALAAGWAGVLISVVGVAAGADAEIALNRRWAEQAFAEKFAEVKPANRLVIVHEDAPGDTKLGRCAAVNAPPMRLGDKVYEHGIGVNSRSVIRVILEKPAARFTSTIGIDRNMDNSPASVRFHVSVDGKDVFATEVIRARAVPRAIDVPLNGAKSFELTVDVGGDDRHSDQADWADAQVILQDGSELWLDDIGRQTAPVGGLPFSFVYGGKHSSEFIHDWKRELREEQLGATKLRRTLTLTDPSTGLEIQAVCTIYLDTAGVDWTVYITNKGSRDTPVIEQVRAVDATFDVGLRALPGVQRHRLLVQCFHDPLVRVSAQRLRRLHRWVVPKRDRHRRARGREGSGPIFQALRVSDGRGQTEVGGVAV